jgi:hypothetical protein
MTVKEQHTKRSRHIDCKQDQLSQTTSHGHFGDLCSAEVCCCDTNAPCLKQPKRTLPSPLSLVLTLCHDTCRLEQPLGRSRLVGRVGQITRQVRTTALPKQRPTEALSTHLRTEHPLSLQRSGQHPLLGRHGCPECGTGNRLGEKVSTPFAANSVHQNQHHSFKFDNESAEAALAATSQGI